MESIMSNPTTTGEWTADKVLLMGVNEAAIAYNIADAHNTALAAEREKAQEQLDTCFRHELELEKQLAAAELTGWHKCNAEDLRKFELYEKQLASERDDRISWQELYEKTNAALASERENVETLKKFSAELLQNHADEKIKLREQLATAVEALRFIEREANHGVLKSVAADTLAKIGTYPLPDGRKI